MKSITKSTLTNEQINKISKNIWDEAIKEAIELNDGWFNTAYIIETLGGNKGIIKIAPPKDVEVMSYERDIMNVEVSTMRLVSSKTSIPIPQIYTYDKSFSTVSSEYFVMEKLKGKPYNHAKESLTESQKEAIEISLGGYNRQINNIKGSEYGLYATGSKRFTNWFECYKDLVLMVLRDGERKNVDISVPYTNITDMVDSLEEVLSVVKESSLLHWDLWDGNFFVNNSEITGLIDFERCMWGDPLMEVFFWFGDYTNFAKGYGEEVLNEKHFDIRRNLYAFHMALAMVVECAYRMYEDDQIKWIYDHFKEKYNNLLESISENL